MYAVAKFCVLCLQRGQKLINIILNDDSDGVVVKQKLLYLLYEVLNLQPDVPKYICEHCLKEINRFYKFKRKCLDNLVILQTYLEQLSDSKRSYQNLSVRLEDYIKPQIKCELNLKTEFIPEIQIEDLESLHETKDDITFSDENEINEDQQNDTEETVEDLHEEDESDEQSEEETVEDTQSTPDSRQEVMKMIGYVPSLSIYECKICSYRSSFYNVKMHALRSHQNHVAHSCSKCGRNFSRLSELEWHQTGNSYCVTQKDLMQESKILAHMSEADLKAGPIFGEEVKKNLKCRVCSAQFRRYCTLKVHIMRKHSTYRPFICSKCNQGFAVLCELQNHESGSCLGAAKQEIRRVIDKKIRAFLKETTDASEDCTQSGDDSKWPNKCNICSIEFTKVYHFKTHILRKHLKYRPYHCSKCNRRFYFQFEFRQHEAKKFCPPVKQIRNVPHHKRHKCTICSCSYIKKWNLKLHMIQVHSYRPHFCPKCGRGFVNKHEFSAHMSRKTCRTAQLDNKSSVIDRKKKFKCSLCNRLFARKFNLDIHKRVRHGVGALHCNKCSRSFSDRDLLIEHKKSEHKSVQEYSYECNTCKEKLRTFNTFKQHLERSSHKSPSCKLCSFSSDNLETFRKHMVFSHDKLIKTFCAKLTTNENMNTLTSGEEETRVVEKQSLLVPEDGETLQNDSLLPVKDNEIDIIKNEPTSLKLLDKDILNEIQEMKSQESKVTNQESVEKSNNGPEIEEIQYFKTPAEGGRKYKCSRCNYCFAELCGLKKHVANSNDKSKPLQCPYCCRRFTSKSFLIKHKLGHFRKKNENRCTICSKVYPSIIELNKHLHENHLEKKQNECEASAKIIIQEAPQGTAINCQHCEFQGEASSMENHLKTHHSYKCEKCDSVFRVKAQLIKHYQTVHTDLSSKFFQCPHCSKLFSIKTNLKRHILIHTGASKPFSCDSCDKSFPDKARLQEHMLKHVGIPLFSCSICKYSAWTQKKLKMHQFDYHKPDFTRIECSPQIEDNSEKINIGVRVHCEKCTFCERSFADNESLKRHIMTHIQNVGKTNKCEVCGIEFAEKEALSLHIKSHSVENLFACAYCPETFAKSRELYRHTIQAHLENTINPIELQNNILVINNDDPSEDGSYKCPICAKLFQSKSNFWRHLLTHAKEKPFKCKFCEHRCNDPGYLEIHMRKHTGEKPYTCLYCPRTFSTSSYLRRHERDVHKIDIASKKTDMSILKCQVCNKRFSKTNYVSHMQSHQKDPPPWNFSCCFCQKSFMDIKTLQNHLIADHQGEVTNNPQTQTSQPIEIVEATPSVSSVVKTEPLGDLTIKVEVQDYEEFILPDQFGA